jgi:hypothetical protein
MGRPKGSKSKSKEGYAKRTAEMKRKYGSEIFRTYGKLGGNPALIKSACTNLD